MGRHSGPRERSRRIVTWSLVIVAVVAVVVCGGLVLLHDDDSPQPTHTSSGKLSERALRDSFAALHLPDGTGVALVPAGRSTPVVLGDAGELQAWSVVKVPLALAAERKHGMSKSEADAVVDSDNASARILTKSLGSPADAAAALSAVLHEGGDRATVLPTAPPGIHPHFGETRWSLRDSAIWTAHLPCMLGSEHVLDLMTGVGSTQRWGLFRVPGEVAVKGGWGVEADGGYLVRQVGVLTLPDGSQVAASISTHRPRMSFEQGTEVLDRVGRWLARHVDALRGGGC